LRNSTSRKKPRDNPSSIEAKRDIAAANRTPRGLRDAMRFKECVQAILLLNQMIQGSQQKDRIGAASREIQFAVVPSRDRYSDAVPFPRPLLLLGDAGTLLRKRKLCPKKLCHLRGSPQAAASIWRPKSTISRGIFSDSAA
jgi:hypothetical protein